MVKLLISIAALVLGGCASTNSYIYTPQPGPNTNVNGYPAEAYGIPPEHPIGYVSVAALGLTSLEANTGDEIPALQVRMILSNSAGSVPWTLDTRQVVASLDRQGQSVPAFVNSDIGAPPTLSIPPGKTATVDLYYPLPEGVDSDDRLPTVDLAWTVSDGDRMLAERTTFASVEVASSDDGEYYDRPYYYGYAGFGLGAFWWYDPFYPAHAFYHHRVFVVPHGGFAGRGYYVSPYYYGHGYGHGYGAHSYGSPHRGGYRSGGMRGGGSRGGGRGGHR